MSARAITSLQSVKTCGMWNSRATRWTDSGVRLHTATISTPGISWSLGMWRCWVKAPAPMMPMRTVLAMLGSKSGMLVHPNSVAEEAEPYWSII